MIGTNISKMIENLWKVINMMVDQSAPKHLQMWTVAINADQRLTVRELEDNIEIPCSVVFRIFREDLCIRHISANFGPKILSDEQKQYDLEVDVTCSRMQMRTHNS